MALCEAELRSKTKRWWILVKKKKGSSNFHPAHHLWNREKPSFRALEGTVWKSPVLPRGRRQFTHSQVRHRHTLNQTHSSRDTTRLRGKWLTCLSEPEIDQGSSLTATRFWKQVQPLAPPSGNAKTSVQRVCDVCDYLAAFQSWAQDPKLEKKIIIKYMTKRLWHFHKVHNVRRLVYVMYLKKFWSHKCLMRFRSTKYWLWL